MNATLMDCLYVPDSTELMLDFFANLYTGNMSNSYILKLQVDMSPLYDIIQDVLNSNSFMTFNNHGGGMAIDNLWFDHNVGQYDRSGRGFLQVRDDLEDNYGGGGGGGTLVNTGGRITFEEQALGVNEGIRDLGVVGVRFFIPPTFSRTNANGRFTTVMPGYGHAALVYIFENGQLKIRSIDFSNTVLSNILSALSYLLTFNDPVYYIKLVNPIHDINDLNTHFNHGSKQALWGMTYNAVQEANAYASTDGINSFPYGNKFLNVMCYYRLNGGASSAPMLGYITMSPMSTGVTNIIWHTMGYTSLYGQAIGGFLPDMIISQSQNNPTGSADLRQTIYHEYGHTRHYFKANLVSNAHWLSNISYSIASGDGYGDNINNLPGNFFALSEGWADFIGHNYAFRRYGTGVTRTEWNAWTLSNVTGNYNQLLENVPTFFNAFIPRGIFHDLMDGGDLENDFDRIQNHTIQQIYNRLNDNTWTIQQFRDNWEAAFPNVNNADLFEAYNIN